MRGTTIVRITRVPTSGVQTDQRGTTEIVRERDEESEENVNDAETSENK